MPEQKQYDAYIHLPVFDKDTREWKVEFIDKDKWTFQLFTTQSKALNFYFDKLRLIKIWILNNKIERVH